MSDGDKKPGVGDISNLKARLGMLNKGTPAPAPAPGGPAKPNPFAPKTGEGGPVDLTTNPDAPIGADTAVVRVERRPSGAPSAAPVARPSAPPAPAAPIGGGLDLGGDLFAKKPEPVAEPAPTRRAAAPSRAELEAAFDQPAAPAAAPEAPVKGRQFANPLQVGEFRTAATPVDLSAEDEAALAGFSAKQQGIKPKLAITMTLAVGAIALLFGFFIGDVRASRRMVNAQIDASIVVAKRMQGPLAVYAELKPVLKAMLANPKAVAWEKFAAYPAELPIIDGSILATPMPLDRTLMTQLTNAVVDINQLFELARKHRRITTLRDKAELQSLERGDAFGRFDQYAVYSVPPDPKAPPPKGIPPRGRVVALVGKAIASEENPEDYVIPIRKRESKAPENVLVRGLTLIKKTDLLESGKGNVLTLYGARMSEIGKQLKKIEQYEKSLRQQLKIQAAREKVFSI